MWGAGSIFLVSCAHSNTSLYIVFTYYWTCSHPEYSWSTARWTISNNQLIYQSCSHFSKSKRGSHIYINIHLSPLNIPTFRPASFFRVTNCNTITFLFLHQVTLFCYFDVTLGSRDAVIIDVLSFLFDNKNFSTVVVIALYAKHF